MPQLEQNDLEPRRTGEHGPEDDGQGPTTRQPQPLHGRPDRRGLARALREPEARSTPMARTCSKGPRSLSIVSILSLPRRRSDRCESASPSRTSVDLPDYNHRPLVCKFWANRPARLSSAVTSECRPSTPRVGRPGRLLSDATPTLQGGSRCLRTSCRRATRRSATRLPVAPRYVPPMTGRPGTDLARDRVRRSRWAMR